MQYRKVGFTTSRGNIWTVSDEKLETDVDLMAVANEVGKSLLLELFQAAAGNVDSEATLKDQLETGLEFFDMVKYCGGYVLGIGEDPEGFVLVPSDSPLFDLPTVNETDLDFNGIKYDSVHWVNAKGTLFESFWASGVTNLRAIYEYAVRDGEEWLLEVPNAEDVEDSVWYQWSVPGSEGEWIEQEVNVNLF